ncbi:MAG: radical SAM protein [Nitrososphaeria archaeon]
MNSSFLAFGPVPSRRLGRSLGINNIPAKTCSYSCVYCQIGRTTNITAERQTFSVPKEILKAVERRVDATISKNEKIDYLTFVPDGEPTLDLNLGEEISLLKSVGMPVAVITNASLIWQEGVREDLLKADYVSLKMDAFGESLWRKVNRPHTNLRLNAILEGIAKFVEDFEGKVVTETMLLNGIGYGNEFERIAEYLWSLKRLNRAYIAAPTRPPTEEWVRPPKEETLNTAFQLFSEKLGADKVELLVGYEGDEFTFSVDAEKDLLNIMAVHPMRREAVENFLERAELGWQIIGKLLNEEKIVEVKYEGKEYYMLKMQDHLKG